MRRKEFIQQSSMATAAVIFSTSNSPVKNTSLFPLVRIPESQRKFKSLAVEQTIQTIKNKISNKEIAWLFENCFPNTLDTTADFEIINGKPDTYVITGDIDAMWLRDSSAQVWPYLPLMKDDKNLQQLIKGVIHRQVKCILKDPYANAFYKDETKISEWKKTDITDMKPGIHERKWEIDSLCYPIRLANGYWKHTNDISVFDKEWLLAMKLVVKTFKEQQRKNSIGPYTFQRETSWATDGVPLGGYGYPTKPNGLICSMFRPSDDATIFPYLIPSNFFAASSMMHLATIIQAIGKEDKSLYDQQLFDDCLRLEDTINAEIAKARIDHLAFGKIFPYETDGFGNASFMDDANVPSLLSLPYLVDEHLFNQNANKDTYLNTRKFVLSENNPFFFKGKAAEGVGGPHAGLDMIWPLSIIMRGITSNDEKEIVHCLEMLQKSHAGTGFMHESFHKDDASNFTRKWFAWANTLFGEFVLKIYTERPHLLNA